VDYAVKVEDLHVNFGKKPILWDISLALPKDKMIGVIGPNGAGKSTFLKALLKIVKPLSGQIELKAEEIAYVPQRESVDWDFPITAIEVVLMGRFGKMGLFGRAKKADWEAARIALEQVGMLELANQQIGQLSGGQQQKLFIARALVQKADLMLLDEPFAGVDLASEKEIIELLKKQKALGKTILMVHHDLPSVPAYFDWVVLLNMRLVACGPVKETFTKEMIAKTFGKGEDLLNDALGASAKSMSGL